MLLLSPLVWIITLKSTERSSFVHTAFVWCRHSPVSGLRIYCGSNFHASVATILRDSRTKATSESDMKNGKLIRAKPGRSISKLECSSLRRRCVRSKRLNTNSNPIESKTEHSTYSQTQVFLLQYVPKQTV